MIKQALEYIVGLREAKVLTIHDRQYSDKELYKIYEYETAKAIEMSTLTSLMDYIQSEADRMAENMLIHVTAPDKVQLISELNIDRRRELLVTVQANLPKIRFNEFISQEEFIIMMQANFVDASDRKLVTSFAGNVEDKTVANYGDDSVTQKATVRTGLASKEEYEVPNPVILNPYRTFQEIQQIPSEFVFRMRNNERVGVCCGLFEADGGAWRNRAVEAVAEYLKNCLADVDVKGTKFTVIA